MNSVLNTFTLRKRYPVDSWKCGSDVQIRKSWELTLSLPLEGLHSRQGKETGTNSYYL